MEWSSIKVIEMLTDWLWSPGQVLQIHNNIPNFTDFYLIFWDFPIAIVGKLRYNVGGRGEMWGKMGETSCFVGDNLRCVWILMLRETEHLCF